MATIGQIEIALKMWEDGSTHGVIKKVTGLAHDEEFAITEIAYRAGMKPEDILPKLANLKPGMKGREIEAVMLK